MTNKNRTVQKRTEKGREVLSEMDPRTNNSRPKITLQTTWKGKNTETKLLSRKEREKQPNIQNVVKRDKRKGWPEQKQKHTSW